MAITGAFLLDDAGPEGARIGVSIGIATGPPGTVGTLLRDADLALYESKKSGKGRYTVFGHPMQAQPVRLLNSAEANARAAGAA